MNQTKTQYHAKIYNFQFEIENLNDTADQFGDTIYNRYWVMNSDNDSQINEAIKQLVLNNVSLNNDYLPEDEDYNQLDLDSQNMILEQAIEDYFEDGLVQVNRISLNSNLYPWLLDWYGWNDDKTRESLLVERNLSNHISNCYITDQYLYYTTGVGYDTADADLLGGNGSGKNTKAFQAFLNGEPNVDIQEIRQSWLA